VQKQVGVKRKNMLLYFDRKLMDPNKSLAEYGIYTHGTKIDRTSQDFYRVKLIEKRVNPKKGILSLGLNTSFYKINSVRKVDWEADAPWFRETRDGLNWVSYCNKVGCKAYQQIVICSRGYGTFNFSEEVKFAACPA
jgi:hypothetical protein